MISYLRGELAAVEEEKAVIDVGGVGYGVFMPQQAQLFGFLTRDDLEIFKLVIGVSGIGPKGGLNILSCMSPDELRFAIMSGDAKAISAAPGIGKKTAEKLIVELKDKVDIEEMLEHAAHGGEASDRDVVSADSDMQAEAVQALVALGYGSSESMRAVKKTSADCTTVEDILKEALKYLF